MKKQEEKMRHLQVAIFVLFTVVIFVPYLLAYAFTRLASWVFELLEPKPDYY
jgi:hypothetical protein